MKLRSIILLIALVAVPVIGIGIYNAVSAPLPQGFPPPTPAGRIEVKHYPAYRSGTYIYQGKLSQAANVAFEPLYQHISSNRIAMTAPVEARYPFVTWKEGQNGSANEQGQAEVSFLYRNTSIQPQQTARDIKVEDHGPMTVVSIGIQGPYTYASYQQNLERLRQWLAQHSSYEVVGQPRRFFYDSPFIPDPLKRSEVQIPVQQKG